MNPLRRLPLRSLSLGALSCVLMLTGSHEVLAQSTPANHQVRQTLPIEYLSVQGLQRAVRVYRPDDLAPRPALIIVLHGGGGDGERFRRMTDGAFERVADRHGFLVAYPDALGRQWNGCRQRAPYRSALSGVDEVAFMREIARYAADLVGSELAGVFVVGYSNGGHLVFRLALEAPDAYDALAAIGAHLPVEEELGCRASKQPVSVLLISGTEDPINPWNGGVVIPPNGPELGRVLSAEATAAYFRTLAALPDEPVIERHPDVDPGDSVRVEIRWWRSAATAPDEVRSDGSHTEVALMSMRGGGHTLPLRSSHFPADLVGRASRDLDGAGAIWAFFEHHLRERPINRE